MPLSMGELGEVLRDLVKQQARAEVAGEQTRALLTEIRDALRSLVVRTSEPEDEEDEEEDDEDEADEKDPLSAALDGFVPQALSALRGGLNGKKKTATAPVAPKEG